MSSFGNHSNSALRITKGCSIQNIKRIAIFAAFDSESRVHQITYHYLKDLHDQGFATIFVSTSPELPSGVETILKDVCSFIVHRENIGYDFYSWKVGLEVAREHLPVDRPVLFTNDSILGPLHSLGDLFQRLDDSPEFVWGLTDSTELGQRHLQSYFLYVSKFHAGKPWFQDFWRDVTIKHDKQEIIESYEVGFTKQALQGGAECKAVFPAEETITAATEKGTEFQYANALGKQPLNTTLFMWDLLITKFQYPFIKAEVLRLNRFDSKAVANWPQILPSSVPNEVEEALLEFEESCIWKYPQKSTFTQKAKIQALRKFLDANPNLRTLIHRIRNFKKDSLILLDKIKKRQWGEIKFQLKNYIEQRVFFQLGTFLVAKKQSELARAKYFAESMQQFSLFLFSNGSLDLSPLDKPLLTIVIILYNKAELTYRCLKSLAALRNEVPFQVLLIDNDSKDLSANLASRLKGIVYIRNKENLGFLKACNQALEYIKSDFILFLNNDTEVHPGSLASSVRLLQSAKQIGAVGSRIILPDGRLQEAGNILWNDGTCVGYARGFEALAPETMYQRVVDYCSGAFLMTSTILFRELSGFDLDYAPAYYEESDYCIRLAKRGYQVIYNPQAAITHVEFGSSEISANALALMTKNRGTLDRKHHDFLIKKNTPSLDHLDARSIINRKGRRLLIIDDRIPIAKWGAGYPRAAEILQLFIGQGYQITIVCTESFDIRWEDAYSEISRDIEIIPLLRHSDANNFFANRIKHYDVIWCSRPENIDRFFSCESVRKSGRKPYIIYDAEAFFSDREKLKAELFGSSTKAAHDRFKKEIANAAKADLVVAVSENDATRWREYTKRPTTVVGHSAVSSPTPDLFAQRSGLLFLGSLHGLDSPNGDSITWFMKEVMPYLRREVTEKVCLHVAGYVDPQTKRLLSRESLRNFKLLGPYDDPTSLLGNYRAIVIPTRYAAGIPQKAFDAAIFGVPTICSGLIASQLGWSHERECLIGDIKNPQDFAKNCARLLTDAVLWNSIRENALSYLEEYEKQFSIEAGMKSVFKTLEESIDNSRVNYD